MKCPLLSKLNEDQMGHLIDLFNRLNGTDFPSITEQLESDFGGRIDIDATFMRILGVESDLERAKLGKALRKAALDQIRLLQRATSGD